MKEERYVQVYTGDGKGKTTAALGLAVRAAGHGMKTYIGQFMKGRHYGELDALKNISEITVEQYGDVACIRKEDVSDRDVRMARQGLEKVRSAIDSDAFDIVVMDEINVAVWFGLLEVAEVRALVKSRPAQVELILTGRRAPAELMEVADLVTEMKEVKHYYQHGIVARTGIEC